ncbi:MAG TPA: HAMP domain-containing sensor histidine kinase, partial [Pseudonocardiaceae bacterium]|nr:HAMP domain-containing sensor histidine kinase [Pseudonocardiaceae bacterium]
TQPLPTEGITVHRPVTAAATWPEPEPSGSPVGDQRRRLPARILIMGWVMLLMLGVLVLVNLATSQSLDDDVEDRVSAALEQENEEFRQFASGGVDPGTGRPFEDAYTLISTHLQWQTPDDNEILFGFVAPDARPGAAPTGRTGGIRQGAVPIYDVSTDEVLRTEILQSPFGTGSVRTPAGELRWQKVRVTPPDGSSAPAGWFVTGRFAQVDQAIVGDTMRTLMLVSVAGLVLAGAGAWLVSGRILAPVRLVRQAAAQISDQDLTRRIPVHGRDDISALSEQFNGMLDRLEEAFSAQRQFVDDAGHELRTPITIIRGHLELMGEDPAERTAVVRIVTDELDRMSRIVEDLLLLATSQRPDFVRPQRVAVADLTCDVDAKVRALGNRRWTLESIGEGTAVVDSQRVTQAMVQLAQNAVQHTSSGDEVRLGSALQSDGAGRATVSFWVTDTGPGVRPEDAQEIFERFSRGSTGGARDHRSGAGLGLAIVRAIADAHRGSVRLISDPGYGATFGLELPASPPATSTRGRDRR